MKRVLSLVLAGALAVTLPSCGTTSVATTWKTPGPMPAKPFERVVALVINATPGERRAAEDQLASMISGNRGVAAYTIIPDDELKDREKIRATLEREKIDGAAVLRLVSSDKETRTISTMDPGPYYTGAGMYAQYSGYPVYRQTTVVDTYFYAECCVYSVPDDRLLWSGQSTTVNPDGIHGLVRDVANAVKAELRKQGIVKPGS